jgi:riboflavin kinase
MASNDESSTHEREVDSQDGTNTVGSRISQRNVATLRDIARLGSCNDSVGTTPQEIAEPLGVSEETLRSRLQPLDEAGLVERESDSAEGPITLTRSGQDLLSEEYIQYRELFDTRGVGVTLSGRVCDGVGEGGDFISLEGYATQFVERLGYEPYAGTLNVELDEVNVAKRTALEKVDAIDIDGWEADGRSFGPVTCYPATIETVSADSYDRAHILVPERTHHPPDILELVADVRLREALGLEIGEVIAVHVQ